LPADGRPRFKAATIAEFPPGRADIGAPPPGIPSPKPFFLAAFLFRKPASRKGQNCGRGKQIVKAWRARAVSRVSPAMQQSGLKQLAASALS